MGAAPCDNPVGIKSSVAFVARPSVESREPLHMSRPLIFALPGNEVVAAKLSALLDAELSAMKPAGSLVRKPISASRLAPQDGR